MREHVWRRGRAQVAVLAAVLAVMLAGSALVGVCVLLMTAAPQRALQLAMAGAPAADVQVSAALRFPEDTDDPGADPPVAATARDAADAVETASALLTEAFGDLPTARTAWRSSVMRFLPPADGTSRLGYLAELDDPEARGTIVSGRWPAAPGEVALPESAAGALGLDVGSTTTLAASALTADGGGADLTVVGTFVPRPGSAWREDPLRGAGIGPDYRGRLAAFGPFVVPPGGIEASEIPLRRVALVVQPLLAAADAADLTRAGARVDALDAELDHVLQDRTRNVVVDRPFARTLAVARAQSRVTGSGVLAVALLGGALAATTVTLAARLVAGRREPEAVLLTARGMGRGRLVAQASIEAAGLAVLSVAPATLLALVVYRALAVDVGLDPGLVPDGTLPSLVASVAVVVLVLAGLLVLPWWRTASPGAAREDRVGLAARSGADLLLLALAVLAYLQLHAHRVATGTLVDPVLVAAPVVCLLAGSALLLRPLGLVARRVDARAGSSRSLALPLAAWGVARRRHGDAAAFLLVLATASAVFGTGFTATWTQSQREQAAAAVGTDLSLAAPADALGSGAVVHAVTGGRLSPVTSRPTVLGSRASSADGPVQVVAVDTREADGMLRGRLPTGGWDDAASGLTPADEVGGAQLHGTRAEMVVAGAVDDDLPVTAALSLVVQDGHGARAALPVGTVTLDGAPTTLSTAVPEDARVVAVDARLSAVGGGQDRQRSPRFTLDVTLRGASSEPGGSWSVATPPRDDLVVATLDEVTAEDTPDGVRLTLEGSVALPGLVWTDGPLTALAFDPVVRVPVVVSTTLADQLGLGVGDEVQLTVGSSSVGAAVQHVVPYVPSQPRGPAVLADVDALSRAALGLGELTPVTDAWWVAGDLRTDAAAALVDKGFSRVTERTAIEHGAVAGPVQAAQRAATTLLVVAAVLLAVAGTALHTTTTLEARRFDVARLRGLGAPRRTVLASVLAEQGFLVAAPVLLGGVLGLLACWAVCPLLAVSADGLPPVPTAAPQWPWPTQAAAVALLVLGCAAVVVPLGDRVVRRSTVARLRTDGPG